jgi:hypothetical protein
VSVRTGVLAGAVGALREVGLDELNAAAALLTRTDRKYVVGARELAPVLAAVTGAEEVRALSVDGRRISRYASTYFDTLDLAGWAASAHPRRRRWKVRTRLYADSDECWLELKTRTGRGATVKERRPYASDDRGRLDDAATAWLGERFGAAGLTVRPADLVTTLSTSYDRATLLLGDSRVTLDENLRWTVGDRTVAAGDVLVVETKSDRGAGAFDRTLWRHGHRPVRLSKYGTGLCVLHPALPSNRWHRVLTRDLALRPSPTPSGSRS